MSHSQQIARVPHDLAKLSLRTAMELDRALHHEQADESLIKAFVEALREGVQKSPDSDTLRLYANVPQIDIFSRAWDHLNGAHLTQIENLRREIVDLLDQFNDIALAVDGAAAQTLKSFCIALHEELVSDKIRVRFKDDPVLGRRVEKHGLREFHAAETPLIS